MSKSDLKAAMDSLQINKPFRLPANQPQFKAPAMVAESPVVPLETRDVIETLVPVATPVSRKAASDQDSSVNLEAHSAPKLHLGYTRIPNNILMRMAEGEFIKSEMQILLVIARFTISFQKRHAPLSKSVLERQTGLRGPAVLQAVASLLEKEMIEKIPGDQYRPNQLGLVFEDDFDFFDRKKNPVVGGTQVHEPTSGLQRTEALSATPAPVDLTFQARGAGGTHFKDTQTISNELSLSTSDQHAPLQEYLAGLKPERKRMSERKAYESLKRDYSDEEICEALSGLKRQNPDGGKYHSPMAYLSVSIEQVLKTLRSVDRDTRRVATVAAREAARAEADEIHKREDEEWRAREASFLREFPSTEQQRVAIETYSADSPFGGEVMRRGLAIFRWWESEQSIKS